MNDKKLKPIQLPLRHLSSLNAATTCERSYYDSLIVMLKFVFKEFLLCLAGTENLRPSCSTWSKTDLPKPVQPSLIKMLQDLKLSDRQELFFMQLPDCMPANVSAHSTDSSLGSTTADRRTVHLHKVSNRNFCLSVSLAYIYN